MQRLCIQVCSLTYIQCALLDIHVPYMDVPSQYKYNLSIDEQIYMFCVKFQICRKYKLADATAYLLEKAGDIQGAFAIILEVIIHV